MQSEDRPIHFSTELVFTPREFTKPALQKLYYDLTQVPGLDYDNSQFGKSPLARFYSMRPPKAQSVCVVLPDRLGILEEWVDLPFNEFLTKVEAVSTRAKTDLEIDSIHTQTVMLRTTFGLSHFSDNRVFLLDHLCAQKDLVAQHFQRPIATGSLRFVLPATPNHEGTFHVVIEPYKESAREVFVELRGVFSNQQSTLNDPVDFVRHATDCRNFINDNLFPYLNQFDVPQPTD